MVRTLKVSLSIKEGYDIIASHEIVVPDDAPAEAVGEVVESAVRSMREQVEAFRPTEQSADLS